MVEDSVLYIWLVRVKFWSEWCSSVQYTAHVMLGETLPYNVQQYSAQENMVMLWNSFANMLGDAWFNELHICNDLGVTTSYDMHTQVQIAY